jgi:hypothetical protein
MIEGPATVDELVLQGDGRMAAVRSRFVPRLVRRLSMTARRAGVARSGVRRAPRPGSLS